MASTGVNVLRWSALGLGLFYGVYHQAKLSSQDKLDAINREYQRKEELIKKAKEEWTKKTAPPGRSGLITNPEDPKFDLEAFLKAKAEEK
ncbi:atp synthase subunit mitochondrial [Diplodia corticola]|uniref:ATP synthase F(0) complex subunit e, mitochondrial n=1 Tax=Diplodia corticola TaxID=236234 RepID=A0A1J9QR56_9PEZI|nr:atp synthase subunit mitochondrial [Diplodia corticola]OJD30897.1 atp synthase subunit mitochondrial [Diplodia corticola]